MEREVEDHEDDDQHERHEDLQPLARAAEASLVMLSVPFALVGGVYLMWIYQFNWSVAVWVGFIVNLILVLTGELQRIAGRQFQIAIEGFARFADE